MHLHVAEGAEAHTVIATAAAVGPGAVSGARGGMALGMRGGVANVIKNDY